jgi:hypothetical protein
MWNVNCRFDKKIANDKRGIMEQFCRDYLLAVAKTFAKAENLELATVSRRFHGAVYFLEDFKNGSVTITLRKFDEMLAEFERHWPRGVKWPKSSINLRKESVRKVSQLLSR